jgi:hypothetical protein
MDYEGQKLAELLFYWIIISFGGVGWIFGYFQQDFFVVVQAWFVGVVISVIVSTVHAAINDCYRWLRLLIVWTASKKYLISQVFFFCLPSTNTSATTARSYVYQTGRFTTETPFIGSSLFRIDDKRHLNNSSKEKVWLARFEFTDGILPGVGNSNW